MPWTMMKRELFFAPSTEGRAAKTDNFQGDPKKGGEGGETGVGVVTIFFGPTPPTTVSPHFPGPDWENVGGVFLPFFQNRRIEIR